LALLLAGCNLFSPVEQTGTSSDGGSPPTEDAGGDVLHVSPDAKSANVDAACDPENDDQFCERNGAECGVLAAEDNCGVMRSARCGTCPEGSVCGLNEPAVCGCEPESADEFCARLARDCGTVSAPDNCGEVRTEECGTCAGDEVCGESTPNVCGCPCDIDGTCVPDGAQNPDNPCETCDPANDPTGWTIRAGETCDDGSVCTENDTCSADGVCGGTQIDCSALDGECQQGLCDALSGCYQAPLPDGTGCTDDGDPCTQDVCSAGACAHDQAAGVCMIETACYTDGEVDPANACRVCDSASATDAWTNLADGTTCPEVDSLACTTSACASGRCLASVDDGFCLIGGACIASGEVNPDNECQSCQPTVSKSGWSNLPDGSTCSSGTCSSGVCGGTTDPCNPPAADECYIDGECYVEGESNPDNVCQVCDPAFSQTGWGYASSTSCDPGLSCASTGSCFIGYCFPNVDPGYCYYGGTCYADGERNPDNTCQYCDVSYSQNTLVTEPGTCFLSGRCWSDGDVNPDSPCEACDSNQSSTLWSVRSGYCRIGGDCYTTGDPSPDNTCLECDPAESQSRWSDAPNSKVCSGTCTCQMGDCKITGSCTP
jgi:hypothetical protein